MTTEIPESGRWGQGTPRVFCPSCGLKTAWLVVRGEVSSLFECKCGHSFERDKPAREQSVEFVTQARLQEKRP